MNPAAANLPFPYLPVRVELRGHIYDLIALLDTGFDGAFLIPRDLLPQHERPRRFTRWTLADGSSTEAPTYAGSVRFSSLGPFPVPIIALGSEPLIGRALLRHVTITLDHGERVIVEP